MWVRGRRAAGAPQGQGKRQRRKPTGHDHAGEACCAPITQLNQHLSIQIEVPAHTIPEVRRPEQSGRRQRRDRRRRRLSGIVNVLRRFTLHSIFIYRFHPSRSSHGGCALLGAPGAAHASSSTLPTPACPPAMQLRACSPTTSRDGDRRCHDADNATAVLPALPMNSGRPPLTSSPLSSPAPVLCSLK